MARRILIVDDDRQMVRTLSDIFELRGWEVAGVYSGEEAVEMVKTRPFDIVLMDILMPGMNGVEALRQVRSSNGAIRVLLMTAHSGNELVRQAERDGAIRILSKPIVIPELLEFLESERPSGHSVVVLDGEEDGFMQTLEAGLAENGHTVHLAGHLDRAIEIIMSRLAGVVVLNLPLEDLHPRESVLAIRRIDPSVILVLCSAAPALLDEAVETVPPDWIYARLMKPFEPERLLEILDEL
jgi:DNA-binding NtrC family response regulator